MNSTTHRHPLTEEIPAHLVRYLSVQDYSLYTPIDQAVWRFICKVAAPYFQDNAHGLYLDGLKETGISGERIPRVEEMDRALRQFEWRAVSVVGFIPPAVFLELQSYGLLPIACDIRKLENIDYTPAPDIVHEAAGHAPIIADPAYSSYLRSYGEVARKAIFARGNLEVYNAIRLLSDTKEDPRCTPAQIAEAEAGLEGALAGVRYASEVDWVSRLGWWTTEYGLVEVDGEPKIYGAGLLSSIGESYHCLGDQVAKIPLSVDCIHQDFDITEPQPQLFVARDFEHLTEVLEELASLMAFRVGGTQGLDTAVRGGTVCTVELDTGLQISGVVTGYTSAEGEVGFLRLQGPSQLAYQDRELPGHGAGYHAHGYSSPLGPLEGSGVTCDQLGDADLAALGFGGDGVGTLRFRSGITVRGRLTDTVRRDGKTLVLAFADCTVSRGDEILFEPAWGSFDLACGQAVTSVFGGAADRYAYQLATDEVDYEPGTHKTNLTPENQALCTLYATVRRIREEGSAAEAGAELAAVVAALDGDHPQDWLLRWELLELDAIATLRAPWAGRLEAQLRLLAKGSPALAETIGRGLALL